MSKSLIKLIDYSLLPALLMVFGKFFGIFAISRIIGIEVNVREYTDSLLAVSPMVTEEELLIITSYSDLIMYAVVAGLFSIVVIRAVFFHDTHTKPTLVAKLANSNMLKLIQNSYEIYHSASIHLVFVWVATAIVIFNAVAGNTYAWIGILSVIGSIILTAILLLDVYKEIENIKNKPGSYNWV